MLARSWRRTTITVLVVIAIAVTVVVSGYSRWFTSPSPGPKDENETIALIDDTQRKYLWDVEHHVLVLSKHWFREIAQHLSRGDASGLTSHFPESFTGTVLEKPLDERVKTSFVDVVRQKSSAAPARQLKRDEMVAYLLGWRSKFTKPPQVGLFPKSLAPRDRETLEGDWTGMGVLRMWGERGPGQPTEIVLRFQFAIPAPKKALEPGWLRELTVTQTQEAHAEKYLLRDVTRDRNIDPNQFHDNWKEKDKVPTTGGVYLADFNRDGILDMLVVDIRSYCLFQGLPDGKFSNVTSEVGLPAAPPPGPAFSFAAFVDIDGDGWEDLLMGGQVYRNDQGKRFIDHTHKTNLRLPLNATGVVIADFDRDGRMDIYSTVPGKGKTKSWIDGHSGLKEGNQLWRNLGDWKFEDVTAASNTSGGSRSVFSAVWLDANNDGLPDVYVPNEFGNGVLLVNRGNGTFREQMIMSGPRDFGTMGIACGDINNDGHMDLYLANMYSKTGSRIIGNVKPGSYPEEIMAKMRRFVSGSQLHLNRGELQFQHVAEDWQMNDVGWAYGPALIDLDNDGFLDVFATSGFMSFDKGEPDG